MLETTRLAPASCKKVETATIQKAIDRNESLCPAEKLIGFLLVVNNT
jgi:hypothetical protein